MHSNNNEILVGCVADDFTGASDVASFLQKEGLNTLLCNGIPDGDSYSIRGRFNAVVIALKTRMESRENAVSQTLQALDWLNNKRARYLYIKYCSTFDSTKEGNIGPIIDAALEKYNIKHTIIAPALPINKRIVKNGCLYVDGIPLHESYMKNHPLTPMWDCNIAKLMEPQGKYDCLNIDYNMLKLPKHQILNIVEEFGREREHFYIIPDYINESDANKIVEIFGEGKLLTGGSGLAAHLGRKFNLNNTFDNNHVLGQTSTQGLIIAGSCSETTLKQINSFISNNGKSFKIDPIKLIGNEVTIDEIWNFITNTNEDILIYSSDHPEQIKKAHKYGKAVISKTLENTMAELAKRAVDHGIKRIIVAGGETAGAIIKKLGFNDFIVGDCVAPGVPIMIPLTNLAVRLVLKSGNFGQLDFFDRVLKLTKL